MEGWGEGEEVQLYAGERRRRSTLQYIQAGAPLIPIRSTFILGLNNDGEVKTDSFIE